MSEIDEAQLKALWSKGAEAWKDVKDATKWVEELRGNLHCQTCDLDLVPAPNGQSLVCPTCALTVEKKSDKPIETK